MWPELFQQHGLLLPPDGLQRQGDQVSGPRSYHGQLGQHKKPQPIHHDGCQAQLKKHGITKEKQQCQLLTSIYFVVVKSLNVPKPIYFLSYLLFFTRGSLHLKCIPYDAIKMDAKTSCNRYQTLIHKIDSEWYYLRLLVFIHF